MDAHDKIYGTVIAGYIAVLIIFVALAYVYREQPNYKKYFLNNGETVECAELERTNCGISLRYCRNEREYSCLTNVGKEAR
jgi:hypothetical protein